MGMRFPFLAALLLVCGAFPAQAVDATLTPPDGDQKTAPLTYGITFSDSVTGFTSGDLSLVNGVVANFSTITGDMYSATVTPRSTLRVRQAAANGAGLISLSTTSGSQVLTAGIPLLLNGQLITIANAVTVMTTPTVVSLNSPLTGAAAVGNDVWLPRGVTVTAQVMTGVAANLASDPNDASLSTAVIYDPTPPTASVAPPVSGISPQTYVITFSEPVVGLFASGLAVTNGTAGSPVAVGDGTVWTVPVTVTGTQRLAPTSVAVKAGGVLDQAGNPGAASAAGTYQPLAVTGVTATPGSTTIGTGRTVAIAVELNHAVAFAQGSGPTLLLETGTTDRSASCTTVAGTTSTLQFTYVTAGGDTSTALDYASTAALALNGGTIDGLTSISLPATSSAASLAQSQIRVNTTPVTATITGKARDKADPLTYTVTFTPAIDDGALLTAGDFAVTNGAISGLTIDAGLTIAQVSVIPIGITAPLPVSLRLSAGAVRDRLGNPNLVSNQATTVYDIAGPTTLLTGPSGIQNGATLAYAVTFSESVTGFTVGDVVLTNATAGSLSGSGASFAVTATPRSTLAVVTGAAAGATSLSIRSTSGDQPLVAGTALWINSRFAVISTAVTVHPTPTTISLANPLAASASAGMDVWLPAGNGVEIQVPPSAADDLAGNPSAASGALMVAYDPTPPAAWVTGPASGVSPQDYVITFSEPVSDLLTTGLTVTGGTPGTPTTIDHIVWTVPITVANRATATSVKVMAGAVRDQANNPCLASLTETYAPLAVSGVTATPAHTTVGKTATVAISVHLNHQVLFTPGSPATLQLETGTIDRLASCSTPAGQTDVLTFAYTVADGDSASPLNYLATGSLLLNGGTIDGLTTLTLPATGSGSSLAASGITVRAASFDATLTGAAQSAQSPLIFTVTFSTAINASSLSAGDFAVISGAISQVDVDPGFTFATIRVVPTATSGELPVRLSLPAGTVTDAFANTNKAADQITTSYDPSAPVLTFSGPARTMTAPVAFTITASKPVTGLTADAFTVVNGAGTLTATSATAYRLDVVPSTTLTLNATAAVGDTSVSLRTTSGSVVLSAGEALLIGTGVVQASATTTTTIGTTPVTMPLMSPVAAIAAAGVPAWRAAGIPVTIDAGAGACKDGANTLSLDPAPATIVYDPTPPLFSVAAPTFSGATATFTLTPSEPVQALDLADLTVTGANAISVVGSGGTAPYHTTWAVRVTPTATDSMSLAVKANAAFDAAGNASLATAATTFPAVPHVTLVDAQNADGSYGAGLRLRIRVTFTEPVTVTGTPVLALAMDAGPRNAAYSGGTGTTVLLFDYSIVDGDAASDLDYTGITALALAGGTLADADGHPADATLPVPGADGSLADSSNLVITAGGPTGPAKPDAGDLPDGSSDGCGAGSGIAILLSLGWLTAGFRRRNRR